MRAIDWDMARRHVSRLLPPVLLVAASLMLWRQLQGLSMAELHHALEAIPPGALLACASCTVLSFACLGLLETWIVRDVLGHAVPARIAYRVGVVSHAFSNTLGVPALTASWARYRGYAAQELAPIDIARILALVASSLVGGVLALASVAALALHLAPASHQGTATWLAAGALAGAGMLLPSALAPGRRTLANTLPSRAAHMVRLVALVIIEGSAAALALHVLLPAEVASLGYPHFLLVFLGASALGVASHAPGGIGVFETAVLLAFPSMDAPSVLAALLGYRAIYNLAPFLVACVAWGLSALLQRISGQHRTCAIAAGSPAQLDGG